MAGINVRTDILEKYREVLDSSELYVFTTDTLYPDSTTHGRMFAPLFGIAEDPATGSGSGPLGLLSGPARHIRRKEHRL